MGCHRFSIGATMADRSRCAPEPSSASSTTGQPYLVGILNDG